MKVLKRLAIVTESRGEHAFGMAWIDPSGCLRSFKRPGSASDGLADLNQAREATAVVAHCRWATHGLPEDNRNNHPHKSGRGWIVHNGAVTNHAELAAQFDLQTETECDSEVLGLLIAAKKGNLLEKAAFTHRQAKGSMALLGLWTNPVRMLVLRDGRPLHFGEDSRGIYFASLVAGLPGKPDMLRDLRAYKLMPDGGQLYMEHKELKSKVVDNRVFRKYLGNFAGVS